MDLAAFRSTTDRRDMVHVTASLVEVTHNPLTFCKWR